MQGTVSNLVYYTNRTRVTKKSPKYKGYMQKNRIQSTKKSEIYDTS